MKKEQGLTDVKITKHLMREAPEPRQKKWLDFDKRLERIVDTYEDYDILDYLKCVGNMVFS